MIYLQTDRIILRDYRQVDIDVYFKLKSDEKTMYYLQDIKLHSFYEAQKDLDNVLKDIQSDNRAFYFFYMEAKESKEQIGSIGYTVIDVTPLGKIVHLGYFIYPKFWNCGFVTEALSKILEFAFLENGVYRITTGCLKENRGSERVMQKCGFIKEAEHINCEWHDGEIKTRVEYRLLKTEWQLR